MSKAKKTPTELTIYHNPRCSKSRQTLALIEDAGYSPAIVRYLDHPLSAEVLNALQSQLGYTSARHMMRKGEAAYKEMGLKDVDDEAALVAAMVKNPKLIERPIVSDGRRAVMGHPPEAVRELLD